MSSPRKLLLLSNSTLHPLGYLEHAQKLITEFLTSSDVKSVLFVPYALIRTADEYAAKAREPFEKWGFGFSSVHTAKDPVEAVEAAEAIFIGGGNTFQLLKALYDNRLIEAIRKRVLQDGIPYIGSSAGTNVSTVSINTTNDMPIVYPPSFEALNLVPFNINPHFLDADPNSTHKGETREERIRQYKEIPGAPPVLALREGSSLLVKGESALLKGGFEALLFKDKGAPKSFPPETDFGFLFQELKG